MVYFPKVEMKSRRVRKSRITRRHRGGFFGKLFEGFQTVVKPMEVLDTDVGGSAGAGAGSLVSNVPGILKALSIDPEMERPTQMPTSEIRSTVPNITKPVLFEDKPTPASVIAPPPPNQAAQASRSVQVKSIAPPPPNQAAQASRPVQVKSIAPTARVIPSVQSKAPVIPRLAGVNRVGTAFDLRRGGMRKTYKGRKGSKSRKARKH